MTRPYVRPGSSVSPPASTPFPLRPATPAYTTPEFGSWWDHLLVRAIFSIACVAAGYHFHPFDLSKWIDAGIGFTFSISVFLFEARLLPLRRRASLKPEDEEALFEAIPKVLARAVEAILANPNYEESKQDRSFMAVHMKGGKTCPRCGHRIAEIRARGEITSYCRGCQR